MKYNIDNEEIQIEWIGKKVRLNISENLDESLQSILREKNEYKNYLLFLILTFVSLLFFILSFRGGTQFAIFIGSLMLLVLPIFFYLARKKTKRDVERILLELESDPEYLILKEITNTKKVIDGELGKLNSLVLAKEKSEQIIQSNQSSELSLEEMGNFKETLNHLDLRIQLRKSKIEFYEKYLSRIKLSQAINIAEDAILIDYDKEKKEKHLMSLNPEKIKEEILLLKPLSDKMKLCESEILAKELIAELNK